MPRSRLVAIDCDGAGIESVSNTLRPSRASPRVRLAQDAQAQITERSEFGRTTAQSNHSRRSVHSQKDSPGTIGADGDCVAVLQQKTITVFRQESQTRIPVALANNLVLISDDRWSNTSKINRPHNLVVESFSVNLQEVNLIGGIGSFK